MNNITLKRALSISELCVYANCSRSTIYKALASGRLRARKNGRSTVILIEDAEEWLKSMPNYNDRRGSVTNDDTHDAA
jgi:excisionase family DNA binding protein